MKLKPLFYLTVFVYISSFRIINPSHRLNESWQDLFEKAKYQQCYYALSGKTLLQEDKNNIRQKVDKVLEHIQQSYQPIFFENTGKDLSFFMNIYRGMVAGIGGMVVLNLYAILFYVLFKRKEKNYGSWASRLQSHVNNPQHGAANSQTRIFAAASLSDCERWIEEAQRVSRITHRIAIGSILTTPIIFLGAKLFYNKYKTSIDTAIDFTWLRNIKNMVN